MSLIAIGLALGAAAAFPLTRLIDTLLYGVKPADPLAFVAAAAALGRWSRCSPAWLPPPAPPASPRPPRCATNRRARILRDYPFRSRNASSISRFASGVGTINGRRGGPP